jgi:hypothetical protein
MKARFSLKFQSGVASLLTAIVLLICITLVVLFTSKTVITETKMTGDNNRTAQAMAAAAAGMSAATSYFFNGGMDRMKVNSTTGEEEVGSDCQPDNATLTLGSGTSARGRAEYRYITTRFWNGNINNPIGSPTVGVANICGCNPGNAKPCAMLWSRGWSDDNLAVHITTQCVTTKPVFAGDGDGPSTPYFAASNVDIGGGASLINRYKDLNIWTGGTMRNRGSVNTYIRSRNETIENLQERCASASCVDENGFPDPNKWLNNSDSAADTQSMGIAKDGSLDVVPLDTSLIRTPDEIFTMFFGNSSRDDVKAMAEDSNQVFTGAPPSYAGLSGVVWIDGDLSVGNGDIVGSPTNQLIIVVNGSFQQTGGTIYGVVYVTDAPEMRGQSILKGALISEVLTPPGSPGAGNSKLVYVPMGQKNCPDESGLNETIGTKAVVAGSWKDW